MARNFVSFSTLWGHKLGGINTFNTQLCKAFASHHPSEFWKVFCIVNTATIEDIKEASDHQVTLICIHEMVASLVDIENVDKISIEEICSERLLEIDNQLRKRDTIFIGHDIISSDCAFAFCERAEVLGYAAFSCVFHHMNYEAYYQNKGGVALKALSEAFKVKIGDQNRILKVADMVYGIGPKLTKSAGAKGHRTDVASFIPGMPLVTAKGKDVRNKTIQDFKAITWGRVEIKNDNVKQYALALAAFASVLEDDVDNNLFSQDSKLNLVGVKDDDTSKWLEMVCAEYYNGAKCYNIVEQTDTQWIIDNLLVDAHISMMLSTHEGFGLVGLESIAAEVPLLISKNSGLYDLLESLYGKENIDLHVCSVKVRGNLKNGVNHKDLHVVKDKILVLRERFDKYVIATKLTKRLLEQNYSWENGVDKLARQFSHMIDRSKKNVPPKEALTQKLSTAVEESRRLYIEGRIAESFDIALDTIERFPTSSSAFLRVIKAGIRMDQRPTLDTIIETGTIKKDDDYHHGMILYEKVFNRNYKAVIRHAKKIKEQTNIFYHYELGVAHFYLGIQQYQQMKTRKKNYYLMQRVMDTVKHLNDARAIGQQQKKDHWWVSVMLLVVYKYLPDYIEEDDWRVSKDEVLTELNKFIQRFPQKASARIYRLLLLMIFEDNNLETYIEQDHQNVNRFPSILLPVDFVDSVSLRVFYIFEAQPQKLEYYNALIDNYIQMYNTKSA